MNNKISVCVQQLQLQSQTDTHQHVFGFLKNAILIWLLNRGFVLHLSFQFSLMVIVFSYTVHNVAKSEILFGLRCKKKLNLNNTRSVSSQILCCKQNFLIVLGQFDDKTKSVNYDLVYFFPLFKPPNQFGGFQSLYFH